MKRFLLACVALCAALSASAQDVILKHDLSAVLAIVQEINDEQIVYKDFNNQNGPIYKIGIDKVMKITFANGTEQVFQQAPVQVAACAGVAQTSELSRFSMRGGIMYYDGYIATEEMLRGSFPEELYRPYIKGNKLASTGSTLIGSGLGLMLGGALSALIYNNRAASDIGLAFVGIGVVVMIPGVPLAIVGTKRSKNAAEAMGEYTHQYAKAPSMYLSTASSGFGLALNF